jgi:hypothetical protein
MYCALSRIDHVLQNCPGRPVMGTRLRFLAMLIASFVINPFFHFTLAQQNEAKRVVIDVSQIGKKMNVPVKEIEGPEGRKFKQQLWKKEDLKKAIADLQYCFKEPEKVYVLTEVPEPWITLALIQALHPLKVHYLYPGPGGTELDLADLKRGKQTPNYDVAFEVVEQGDKVFINLNSDRPEAATTGKHTFDLNNLPKVLIPDIQAGKHVFIHGKGAYGVMVSIARNYIKNCKSLSMAAHETDYTCAVSNTKGMEPGDVTSRTLKNNL